MKNSVATEGAWRHEGAIYPYDETAEDQRAVIFEVLDHGDKVIVNFERGPNITAEIDDGMLKIRNYVEGREAPVTVTLPTADRPVSLEFLSNGIKSGELDPWNKDSESEQESLGYLISHDYNSVILSFTGGQIVYVEVTEGNIRARNYIDGIEEPLNLILPMDDVSIHGREIEEDRRGYDASPSITDQAISVDFDAYAHEVALSAHQAPKTP